MFNTKRIISILLVLLMLFTSLPLNVFAEESTTEETTTVVEEKNSEEENTEYQVGQEYTIKGVRYKVDTDNTVDVLGEGEGMPERVEILSLLGDFPVKEIAYGAFQNCETVKEVILPETVTYISYLAFSGSALTDIEINGKNVDVRTDFKNTPLYENPDNWKNGVLIVSGYAVMSNAEGNVVLDENVIGIGEKCFGYNSLVTNLTILNPDCHIFNSSGTLPLYATIYGYKDSTAQKHARTYSYNFSALCGCEGAVFKPATNSYCNGVIGYSEGYWCDNCNTYSSGGFEKDTTFDHTDLDGDGVCDFCKLTTDTVIVDSGKSGDNAFWCITDNGLVIIGGEGEAKGLYSSASHQRRGKIKELLFLDGITSIGAEAFEQMNTVEKITVSDTVTEIKSKAFYGCFKVEEIVLGKGLKTIGTQAFADSNFLQKVVMHEGVIEIGGAAFACCRQLVEVTLPTTLETIGYRAFENCERLNDVVFYDSLKSIGRAAFYNCTRLTKIVIPESVGFVDQIAFKGCTRLADIEMKAKYIDISTNCFSECPGYSKPENIKNGFRMLGTVAFYETEAIHTEIVLGEEITSLARGWLGSKTNIKDIYVPDRRCFVGEFNIVINDLVVHGYKDSYAEAFAEKVKAFFDPICECENTEFFPATQSSCDGTVGYTEGEWCDYCATWKTGHEINTENIHDFGEDLETCLRCGESKEDKIVSIGVLNGGFWILTNNDELVVYGKGTVSLPKRTPDIKSWMKVIGEEAKTVRIKNTVEKIGDGLFKNGTSLEKIEIENGVYSIGANAFYNCNNVKEMTLSVILLEIGANAFESMSALESVTVPSAVYKIGSAVFKNCTSLKEAVFEGTPETMDMNIFNNCISLESVVFNEEIYTIPSQMFYNCTLLKNIEFKNTYLNSVGDSAFYGCKSLTAIPLPIKNSIYGYAFYGCEGLKEITIISPTVSGYAFKNCKGLETVNIDVAASMNDGVFEGCSSLENVNFPEGKKVNMGMQCFKGCTSLESIVLPETWTAIPQTFFYGCTSLKNIELPENVKTIGSSAFYGCSSLERITLGEKVTAVNSMAFYGADSLSEITFLNKNTKIAAPEKVNEVYCNAIPVSALMKGYTESTADTYAENYGNEFSPLDEAKAVKEISVETYPTKHHYVLNQDTEINLDNLTIKVTYEDDTTRIFKSRFTVDTSACDLTKAGTYPVKITFENKETFFMITVWDNDNPLEQNAVVLPENGELKFKYNSTTSVTVKFIPEETKTYYFLTTGNVFESMIMPDGSYKRFSVSYKKDFHKLQVDLVEGEVYYIALNCKEGSSVTIKQTGICDLQELPDGTYKIIRYLSEKSDVVIPGEINGKKVTVIGENSFEGAYAQSITLGEGIEVIEKEAFINITRIKSVSLPDTLKKIGEKAFCRLSSLETVNGGKNVEEIGDFAFEYCSNLVNFTLSEKVRTIGSNAFYSCGFSDITFPETLEKVGDQAFSHCNKLSKINFLCEKADFGRGVFESCYLLEKIALPSGNTGISPAMFSACTALTEIVLPENIVSIGQSAFYNCNKVKSIKFNGNIRSIGSSAFALCNSLETIEIPGTVTDFGNSIFYECKSLKTVTFLGENPDIPEKMFFFCDNLERINYKGTITYVGDDAFRGCSGYSQNEILENLTSIGNYAFAYSNLTEINLSEDITYLGVGAFANTNVRTAVLPKSVTKIPSGLFNCSSVESVTLLGEVTQIGANAFRYCEELKEINIPSSVEIIGETAFGYAHALEITVNLESIREVGKDAFWYSAIKGVTFGNRLQNVADDAFAYTNIERVVIPEGVTVGMYAFADCNEMVEAIVGKNSAVDFRGFAWCDNLEKVVVEDGATLGIKTLDGCKNLKELHFKNTISPTSDLGTVSNGVTVYGLEESYAHRYAEENGFKFVAYEGSAHIHNYQSELLPETKCNVYRKTRYYCSCGKEYTRVADERTHVYGDFTIDREPTCTQPGIKSKHCICGKTRSDITVIEPLGHTEVIDIPAVAPTSTEPGYTHQSHCSVCGETVVKRELISHSEYDILVDDSAVTAYKFDAATAENDGMDLVITFTLKNNVCMSNIEKTVIYKVGEVKLSNTRFTYNGKVQKPAVTVKDSTGEPLVLNRDYKVTYPADSKYCGEYSVKVVYVGNYAGSKTLCYDIVHNWSERKITQSPTCTKTGVKTFTCGCGESYSETIAKLEHTYDNNCDKTCNVCKATRNISHSYRIVTTKATLSENGKVENKCIVCGYVSKATTVYYPGTIKLSATSYTYNGKLQRPTVTVKNSKGTALVNGTDYTVAYSSGFKNPGKYAVRVTFRGNYTGSQTLYFTILPGITSSIATAANSSAIKLTWKAVPGATGYRVYLYDASAKKYTVLKTTTAISYTATNLKSGTSYKFAVKAYSTVNGKVYWASVYKTVTATTSPGTPTLSVTAGAKKATLKWTKRTEATGYVVYMATSKTGTYTKIATIKNNSTVSMTKTELAVGKTYYFKVAAYKTIGGKTVYGSFSSVKSIKVK